MKKTKSEKKEKISKPITFTKKKVEYTTVYIGNLKYTRDETDLKRLFSQFGEVKSVSVVLDSKTQISKGIAFVKMVNKADALIAIKELNGQKLDGRTAKVSIANDRFKEEEPIKPPSVKKLKASDVPAPRRRDKKTNLDKLFDYLKSKNK